MQFSRKSLTKVASKVVKAYCSPVHGAIKKKKYNLARNLLVVQVLNDTNCGLALTITGCYFLP